MKLSRRQFLTLSAITLSGAKRNHTETFRRLYCPILMYHHIGYPPPDANAVRQDLTVSPELFTQHLIHLKNLGYTSITMDDLWAALTRGTALPAQPVVITFDDGYDNAYDHAFPRLQDQAMVGTFFLISEFMGQPGYMTWEQAQEMLEDGMELGNHTRTHPDLSTLDRDAQHAQIQGAADQIEAMLDFRPRFFCYPLGRFNDDSVAVVRETGHDAATTIADGTLKYSTDLHRMTRVRIRNITDINGLEWLITRRA